jgi:glutamine synthetase
MPLGAGGVLEVPRRRPRYPTNAMATRRPRRSGPDLTAQARRAGVRLVRFLYTDNGGITRGKATHVDGLAHRLTDGIGLTVAMQAMNMLDQLQPVEGLGPVGEIRLVPDPQTFTVLPYAPHAAAMTSDMRSLTARRGRRARTTSVSRDSLPHGAPV